MDLVRTWKVCPAPFPGPGLDSHKSLLMLEVPGQLASSRLPQPQPCPTCGSHTVRQIEGLRKISEPSRLRTSLP